MLVELQYVADGGFSTLVEQQLAEGACAED
jgi:hypothetical protein